MPAPDARAHRPRRAPGAAARAASSEAVARVFAALGDATRLRLVAVLCAGGALSIAQLTANTEISRQGVTKHLQVLADAGVVRDLKQGRERLWQLEPEQIAQAQRSLEAIGREWEAALGRLKAFAELR
jgi:DNA-binding transcriptional ArsR family regulator